MRKLKSIGILFITLITVVACAKNALEEHFDLANKYLYEADYGKAVLEFSKMIELEPEAPDLYMAMANAQILAGDEKGALESIYEAVVLLESENYSEYPQKEQMDELFERDDFMSREETLLWWYDRCYYIEEYNEYIKWLEEYLEDYIDFYVRLIDNGYKMNGEGKHDEALLFFAGAEAMYPEKPEAYIGKAHVLTDRKKDDYITEAKDALANGCNNGVEDSLVYAFTEIAKKLYESVDFETVIDFLDYGYLVTKDERIRDYINELTDEYYLGKIAMADDMRNKGLYDDALLTYGEAEDVIPERAEAYIGKSKTFADRFDENAISDIENALTQGYNYGDDDNGFVEAVVELAGTVYDKGGFKASIDFANYGFELTEDARITECKKTLFDRKAEEILSELYPVLVSDDQPVIFETIAASDFSLFKELLDITDYNYIYFPDGSEEKTGHGAAIYSIVVLGDRTTCSIYCGDFVNGMRHGNGIQVNASSATEGYYFKGVWLDDTPNGYGVGLKLIENNSFKYSGQAVNGLWDGEIKAFCYSDSKVYTEQFENGLVEPLGSTILNGKTVYYVGVSNDNVMLWREDDPRIYTHGIPGFSYRY